MEGAVHVAILIYAMLTRLVTKNIKIHPVNSNVC